MGNGPFIKESARRGDSVHHVRNPSYFKEGRPFFDEMTVQVITDSGTIAAAFKARRLDSTNCCANLDLEAALKLGKELEGKYSLFLTPMNSDVQFFANVEREPWTDARLINAFRLATDQQEIFEAFGEGKYAYGIPFPLGSWYGHTVEEINEHGHDGYGGIPGNPRTKQQDIDDAIAMLKDAGYDPPSELGDLQLTCGNVLWFADLCQLWVQQIRRNLGIELEIRVVDASTAVKANTSGDFDLSVWGYGINIFDPDDFVLAIYGPGSRNYTKWQDPVFDEAFEKQAREFDRDKRTAILRELEEYILDGRERYVQVQWVPVSWLTSDKIRTEAGAFVAPPSNQVILKWEHTWFEE